MLQPYFCKLFWLDLFLRLINNKMDSSSIKSNSIIPNNTLEKPELPENKPDTCPYGNFLIEPKSKGEKTPDSITDEIQNSVETKLNPETSNMDNCPELKFNGVEISKLTKRQLKKYKKFLEWQNVKKVKRAKEKEKLKEKKKHAKINNIDLGPSRKELKRKKMANSPCKVSVCIDLSFDYLMIDKDMAKTIKQILRVYTENRRVKAPMQLHLSSFKGRSKEEMERHNGYEHWDINFHESHYLDVFPKEKLVYLTSDSENVIHTLEDDKVYIIGGLVDHNGHKGICYNKAVEEGIAHGQLPIGEYFWMKQRKVLTINQVFDILLRVSEGKTFREAFEMILPKRKEIVSLKQGNANSEDVTS